ncbi:MAG: hypothetical protein ACK4F9_04135 [Brevinematia bacterium]
MDLKVGMGRDDYIVGFEGRERIDKRIDEKIKEEEIKAKIEGENEKELREKLKKSVINEDDMRVLLLVFGSRGSTVLLDKVIEKIKKQNKVM